MLTNEEKQAMIDYRIKFYESKIFELEMDKVACGANGDDIGAKQCEKDIESLIVAIEAVKKMAA